MWINSHYNLYYLSMVENNTTQEIQSKILAALQRQTEILQQMAEKQKSYG